MICWFLLVPFVSLLWFRCLSPFFSPLAFLRTEVLFHHDLLVPRGVPVLVSLLLSSFFSRGQGFCSIMICWFLLVPFVSLLWFRCLSPFFSLLAFLRTEFLFHHDLLVPRGVPVLVSRILSSLVPVLVPLLLSSFFPQDRGSVSSWFSWFLFVLVGVLLLVSFLLSFSFLWKGLLFHHDLLVRPFRAGVLVLVSFLRPFFPQEGACVPS